MREKVKTSLESKTTQDSRYQQELVTYNIKIDGFKGKSEYGYNAEFDFVCISKDGTVGEILEVQGLRIGIPKAPDSDVYLDDRDVEEQVWTRPPKPKNLKKIKDMMTFMALDDSTKNKYKPYISEELDRRKNGFWFMCNGKPTYLTGSHYMFLQWTKIDAEDGTGFASYREPNRLFYYFWEACVADKRSYGMCYLKNRRSGFSTIASSELVNSATLTKNSRYGILSKTGGDAKKMFTNIVVPINIAYPFFFKPIQSGEERPKSALEYNIPSERLSKKKLTQVKAQEEYFGEGLNSSIDHKNTGDNSYDGEKLKILVHDESGKWEKPESIKNNWMVTKTCLRVGRKIIGKCMMGSTSNSLDKGGEQFKEIYENSDLRTAKRNANGQTSTGLYSLFINVFWNTEGCFDKYGTPIFDVAEGETVYNSEGDLMDKGSVQYWENDVEGYKFANDQDGLNEFYRQNPVTESHAFRDEAKDSLFNLSKIYAQIDYNDGLKRDGIIRTGSFYWVNGDINGLVAWRDDKNGRFRILDSAILPRELTNLKVIKNGLMKPSMAEYGAFGCDSYDISGTVGGGGSNGALHGITKLHMDNNYRIPQQTFFLEYIARPQTSAIFWEEVLMACVYYGMPILIENNKPGILHHFARTRISEAIQ